MKKLIVFLSLLSFMFGTTLITVPTKSANASLTAAEFNQIIGAIKLGTYDLTTGKVTANNLYASSGIYGTLQTAAQTNITSVGTLPAATITVLTSTTGNITNVVGTIKTAAQPNITSLGTIGTLTATNITATNTTANKLSDGTIKITGGALTGATGVTATNLTGTLQTAAQTNITSLGTLAGLTTGAGFYSSNGITVNAGNLYVNAGNVGIGKTASSTFKLDAYNTYNGGGINLTGNNYTDYYVGTSGGSMAAGFLSNVGTAAGFYRTFSNTSALGGIASRANWTFFGQTAGNGAAFGTAQNAPTWFFNNNANTMVISQNGNVGIGKTAPSTKLDVAGTVSASALQVNGAITGTGILNKVYGPSAVNIGTTVNILLGVQYGIVFISDTNSGMVGMFVTYYTNTFLVADPSSIFSATAGAAGKISFYYNASGASGAGYYLSNQSVSNRSGLAVSYFKGQ